MRIAYLTRSQPLGYDRTITLLNNPQLACTMGRAGRLLAEEHDIQRTWSLHEKLYMGLVRKSHIPHAQPVFEKVKLNPWKTVKTRIGLK